MTSPLLQLPNTYRAFYGGFSRIHPVQRDAVVPILEGRDLILQAATGSGKTEAVLAPCAERVIRSGRAEAVLYIVPTKALAIDLERRLTPILTHRLGLQFGIRTGDTKRTGGGRPDLMLTTPESLDVLLGSSNATLKQFLQRVRMVVIDEVHPLLHQYRGRQLSCLLRRLERRTGGAVQKITLSATIADVDATVKFFGFGSDTVRLVSNVQREIESNLVFLKREDDELVSLLDDLYHVWNYRKVLMFANSRGRCDRLFALVNGKGAFRGVSELHYSNLKPRERRATEERFRRRSHALCVATSTLELGIDVGDVDGVILFEPPDSVSAFLQRIGRSNRRGSSTRFWGICRGERAGEQLVRFAGLLRLARMGTVEVPVAGELHSVLVQQVLSCLYEKKYISLPAMQALFPECRETLGLVFQSMESQGWLRHDPLRSPGESGSPGRQNRRDCFFKGGWRYRDALLERMLWSNFPETEEDYALEISGEAVADLPRSIVRQLDPGDRVHLVGRRIRILQIIDSGERKRILAEPSEDLDEKEILWLGAGFHVSFEVAQSMWAVLKTLKESEGAADLGLFSRTRKLLREESEKHSRSVILANGIEVFREYSSGFYRYCTFLGSLGNLVLRVIVEKHLGGLDDLYVSSDEIGITCSHWIDFQRLPLPRSPEGFRNLVLECLRPLRALLPLNAYANALPGPLLVEEIMGFLYDSRVSESFARYLSTPSEIVVGDPSLLEFSAVEPTVRSPVFLQPSACPSLLEWEKERWPVAEGEHPFVLPEEARHIARPLTGTMLGEYIRHRQCERWMSFHFLPPGLPLRPSPAKNQEIEAIRTERGRRHEEWVLTYLRRSGAHLLTIPGNEADAGYRSLEDRFNQTLDHMGRLILELPLHQPTYLSQAVLMAPSLLLNPWLSDYRFTKGDAENGLLLERIDGVGIPDLIRVSTSHGSTLLEVGDIKDSPAPYYSQKWQVAFYALLLEACTRKGLLPGGCHVSRTGFLILRRAPNRPDPVIHSFELDPFMAAFPALLHKIGEVLSNPPAGATCHLHEHCTTCPFFEICYRQALHEEDIQFIPGLSDGELWKMRQLGLTNIDEAAKWFDSPL